jgi:hypothetical protein
MEFPKAWGTCSFFSQMFGLQGWRLWKHLCASEVVIPNLLKYFISFPVKLLKEED